MKTPISKYIYELPKELIAQFPPSQRGTTNLLVVDRTRKTFDHKKYFNVVDYINEGDLVILNNTKVLPSRLYGKLDNGKEVELLLLNPIPNNQNIHSKKWNALLGGYRHKPNQTNNVHINGNIIATISQQNNDGTYDIIFNNDPYETVHNLGHTPLPKYITRQDNPEDAKRYQTIFSKIEGSVASPTASLNLTKEILSQIKKKAQIVYVTLYVGWGTFSPIRTEYIEDHQIHSEYIEIPKSSAKIINNFINLRKKENNRKLIAFGTTVCRTLESVFKDNNCICEYKGTTNLYIYPPFKFNVVDKLVTNFHTPKSSLLTLVSAFMGYDLMIKAYQEAIEKKYNFLSYGDSMIII
ncbi:MAG TPA: tRNA preQ1(34) S-adenosylmethionine ribosyltransferase-isomerase QueA [Candidatus Dojkabacteria bacterium]|nr:tRNA preQ1(34) S-adenosylmethionine ribosyltransferase-isomerase QueA [Candidatus Dojkabacteria bacterium]